MSINLLQRFVYKELVTILLKMVAAPASEEFVQRIGIYLLNSLACQVDGNEKKLVGDLGAINVSSLSYFLSCL